jgi:transportin-3
LNDLYFAYFIFYNISLQVSYVLLSLTRTYEVKVIEWTKESLLLIPPAAVTEAECSSFLSALSKAASGSSISHLTSTLEELSDVCRRNRNVQDMVQGALRPLDWNFTTVA